MILHDTGAESLRWGMCCGYTWASLGFSCPREVWSTSKWQHIWFCVQAEGRWTPEVFISAAGGMSLELLATQRRWTHSRDINQSLHEQDCHFLCECWKINLAINLSLLCLRLLSALYKWRKMQPVEFFSTMNHSEVAKVQLVMFSLVGRLFNSKVRCVLVLVQPRTGCYF